jgi:hypothetical protein
VRRGGIVVVVVVVVGAVSFGGGWWTRSESCAWNVCSLCVAAVSVVAV